MLHDGLPLSFTKPTSSLAYPIIEALYNLLEISLTKLNNYMDNSKRNLVVCIKKSKLKLQTNDIYINKRDNNYNTTPARILEYLPIQGPGEIVKDKYKNSKVPFANNMENDNKNSLFCEKLENKWRYVVRCLLTFWLFSKKIFGG